MGDEMSEGIVKSYISVAASFSIRGPSGTLYDFSREVPLEAKTTLDEQWMDDLCIDRSREKPPQRARLKMVASRGTAIPTPVVEKESVFAHSHTKVGNDPTHTPVPVGKTQEQTNLEIEAAQATELLQKQQAITDEILNSDLLEKSIPDILAVIEGYLLADFEVDIPRKQRIGNVNALIGGDPKERKSLPGKVEELIESLEKPEEPKDADSGEDNAGDVE